MPSTQGCCRALGNQRPGRKEQEQELLLRLCRKSTLVLCQLCPRFLHFCEALGDLVGDKPGWGQAWLRTGLAGERPDLYGVLCSEGSFPIILVIICVWKFISFNKGRGSSVPSPPGEVLQGWQERTAAGWGGTFLWHSGSIQAWLQKMV